MTLGYVCLHRPINIVTFTETQSNTLGLLYAQLELDFNFIRAVTPFYSVYEIRERNPGDWKHVLSDRSEEAKIVRRHWKSSGKFYKVRRFHFPVFPQARFRVY